MFVVRSVINKYLFAMLGSTELVKEWWSSPNKAFQSKTPEEMYAADPDKVLSYVLGASDGYW
jgi:hypothetical protein